ncbi:hypothetical protein IWW38_001499, partial [Coemansia aciculifera]
MSFVCAISGDVPTQPVVSTKTGRVYEHRLLQKHLTESRGIEPHSEHELTLDDIISISCDPPSARPPRPPTLTSIPALLATFQNEWDAVVLESFELKQQYQQVRQELSHALYQNDAACRVVARLMKERDDARTALATLQAAASAHSMTTEMARPMDVDSVEPAEEVESDSDPAAKYHAVAAETAKTLSKGRVKREAPADLTSADAWKTAQEASAVSSLHSTTKPGITSLDVSSDDGALLLTGGMDNHAEVYSRSSDHVIGTLKGHTKRVTAALWLPGGDNVFSHPIITASADKSVRLWMPKPANSSASADSEGADVRAMGWVKKNIVKHHSAEVVGLAIHPSGQYFASAAQDGGWAVHSAESGDVVLSGSINAPL